MAPYGARNRAVLLGAAVALLALVTKPPHNAFLAAPAPRLLDPRPGAARGVLDMRRAPTAGMPHHSARSKSSVAVVRRSTHAAEETRVRHPWVAASAAVLLAAVVHVLGPAALAAEAPAQQVAGFAEFAEKGGAMDVNPACFVTDCGKQTKECFVEDSKCLKGALCLSRCRGGQDCATQCFAEYGCRRLDAWLKCTVEDKKCVSVPQQLIDVDKWFTENVPKKLPNFDPASMQGKWYKVRGYNPKYDCYLCQPNTFNYPKGSPTVQADVQLRVQRLKSGGFWQNIVKENLVISPESERSTFRATGEIFGLSFDEEWYVLAGDEDFKLVAYKGKNLQDIYEGAFVYTRTPSLPVSMEAKVRKACEDNGYIWSKFCTVDNSCPEQPLVKEQAATLTLDDIPDLIEWFAPGTVPKKQFSGQYN